MGRGMQDLRPLMGILLLRHTAMYLLREDTRDEGDLRAYALVAVLIKQLEAEFTASSKTSALPALPSG